MYALDANSGAFIWKTVGLNFGETYKTNFASLFCAFSPTVVTRGVNAGMIFVGGGVTYQPTPNILEAAFNASTGALIWTAVRAGNSEPIWIAPYLDGQL
jgi:outer membrane protein assembly factor BamB